MRSCWNSLLSAFGIPLLGLGMLLVSLWHPNLGAKSAQDEQSFIYLQQPDPRLDPALSILLSQQAKEVAHCRAKLRAAEVQKKRTPEAAEIHWRRTGVARAIADYNLIARECSSAVFQTTHLPPSLTP